MVVGAAVVFAVLATLIIIPWPNFPTWAFAIGPIGVPLVFIWAAQNFIRQRFHRAILAQQICPACTYSLVRLEADQDGCTVCPECGAAWHVKTA